jgi:hypothetical protein
VKDRRFVRAFASLALAVAMALAFGGCIMPRNFPIYGGYGGYGGYGYGRGPYGYGRGGYGLGGYGGQIVVSPPNAMVAPAMGGTVAGQQLASNYAAAATVGAQQVTPYIVGANPTNPYGINQSVPLPGMLRIQTGCTGGQWYVPPSNMYPSGTCSQTAWIPGVNPVWVPNGGVVEVPANQLGPGGGVQGVPGATMPMVPGFQGGYVYGQRPFVGGYNNFPPY